MGVADLLRDRKSSGSLLYEGIIDEDADTVSDMVRVRVLAFDKQLTWGPAPWMPRVDEAGDAMLPSRGDRCVVGLADTDDPGTPEIWILAWWP
jgi:hypothetical protein